MAQGDIKGVRENAEGGYDEILLGAYFTPLTNQTFQSLSGTTPAWNVVNGVNALITLTGETVITLSNLITGMGGTIHVTNASPVYSLQFAGYTNKIADAIYSAANTVITSGGDKEDSFSWIYDGSKINWFGGHYFH